MNFLSLFTRRASILGLGAALAGWGIVFFAALHSSGQPALASSGNASSPPPRRRSRRMVLIFQAWITGFS